MMKNDEKNKNVTFLPTPRLAGFYLAIQQGLLTDRDASLQQAVWRQSGCMLAESLVGILKFIARLNFSVPTARIPNRLNVGCKQ